MSSSSSTSTGPASGSAGAVVGNLVDAFYNGKPFTATITQIEGNTLSLILLSSGKPTKIKNDNGIWLAINGRPLTSVSFRPNITPDIEFEDKTDFTGSRLTDLQVLAYADDRSFTNLCKTNLLLHKICTDPRQENELYKLRIKIHMPQFEKLIGFSKPEGASGGYYTPKEIYKIGRDLQLMDNLRSNFLASFIRGYAVGGDRIHLEILKIKGLFPPKSYFIQMLESGKLENAKFMLENGIVNSADNLNNRDVFPLIPADDEDPNEDLQGRLAGKGRLKELQWLAGPPFNLDMTSEEIMFRAVKANSIPLLEWLMAPPHNNTITITTMNSAAREGHFDLLKWLINRSPNIRPNISTANAAAINGYIDIVKWLADSLDDNGRKRNILPDRNTLALVGQEGNFDILNFLADTRQLLPSREYTIHIYGTIDPAFGAWMQARGI